MKCNKRTRALAAMLMALQLVATAVTPAFAAGVTGTYQWDDRTVHYTASVTISNPSGGSTGLAYPTSGNGVVHHYENTAPGYGTTITLSSNRSITRTWTATGIPAVYQDKIKHALANCGFETPHYYVLEAGNSVFVPGARPTGYYAIARQYHTPNGIWSVVSQPLSKQGATSGESADGINTLVSSGNIYYALGSLFGSYTYKAL